MKGFKCDRCKDWLEGAGGEVQVTDGSKPSLVKFELCPTCIQFIRNSVERYQVVRQA